MKWITRSKFIRSMIKKLTAKCMMIVLFLVFCADSARAAVLEKNLSEDIAWSLLRDNYDAWSGELMNLILTESAQSLVPINSRIDKLSRDSSEMSIGIKTRLTELYKSVTPDETSVQSALFLARGVSGKERREYLKTAVRHAQSLAPASRSALRVSLVYLSTLLADKEIADARRFGSKVFELAQMDAFENTHERCLAFALAGDGEFFNAEFGAAEEMYSKSAECFALNKASVKVFPGSLLAIRMAWVSFRLMKYQETLVRLEKLASTLDFDERALSTAVRTELSVMLAVSLSETAPNFVPSFWIQEAQRSAWVTVGLIRSLKYAVQKDAAKTAIRWIESLEPVLSRGSSGMDFFSTAMEVYEQDGAIEAMDEFRIRAVLSLQPQASIAKEISMDSALDGRRRKLLREWARAALSSKATQNPASMSSSTIQSIYKVTEALYSESSEVCSELPAFVLSHRILAASAFEPLAERVYSWFKNCSDSDKQKTAVTLSRLEMFRSALRRSSFDGSTWSALVALVHNSLELHGDDSEIRKFALESVNDAIERQRFNDAEKIAVSLLLSQDSSSEIFQFERESLLASLMRILVQPKVSAQIETAAWLVMNRLSASSAPDSGLRFKFESVMAYHLVRKSLALRNSGRIFEAVQVLIEGADRFSPDSATGRDLRVDAALQSCLAGLDVLCVATGARISSSSGYSAHDMFSVRHALGEAYNRTGRFLSAAESWLGAAGPALESGKSDLIRSAKSGVMRAGDIFAELKMWPEVISARTILTKVASLSGDAAATHPHLLDWATRAFATGNFSVASLLALDLNEWVKASVGPGKGKSRTRNPWVIAGDLVEQSLPFWAAFGESGKYSRLFAVLEESLVVLQKGQGVFVPGHPQTNRLLVGLLDSTSRRWKMLLSSESDRASRSSDVASFDSSLSTVSRNFDTMVKLCRLTGERSHPANYNSAKCIDEVVVNFGLYVSRLRESASRLFEADLKTAVRFDGKLNAVHSRIMSLKGGLRSLDAMRSPEDNPFVERSRSLLGVGLGELLPPGGKH